MITECPACGHNALCWTGDCLNCKDRGRLPVKMRPVGEPTARGWGIESDGQLQLLDWHVGRSANAPVS